MGTKGTILNLGRYGALALSVIVVVSCQGRSGAQGEGNPSPTARDTSFAAAEPTPTVPATTPSAPAQGPMASPTAIPRVGAPDLQLHLDAIASGDAQRIISSLAPRDRPCQTSPVEGIGQGPACPPGVGNGTLVPALGVVGCGGYFVTGADVLQLLDSWLVGHPNVLYGVYQDAAGQIIAEYTNLATTGLAMKVFLLPGGITGIGAPCGDQGLTMVLPPGAVWLVGGPGK
ncbi:MAG: hypothetical protein C0506_13050 [Anaerolinea sp.]|nr:hypothetical protein [Anaerolinea sp.]